MKERWESVQTRVKSFLDSERHRATQWSICKTVWGLWLSSVKFLTKVKKRDGSDLNFLPKAQQDSPLLQDTPKTSRPKDKGKRKEQEQKQKL